MTYCGRIYPMVKAKLPKIAIVGRPNVGKSSLFNRIVGARTAIVESKSGTTRDRLYADIRLKDRSFTLIDTGGFEKAKPGEMAGLILKQLEKAIQEADIIAFVTDGAAGILPQDRDLAAALRKTSKKIYLVVNKIDDDSKMSSALEFFELGLGEPYAVSAANGAGVDRFLEELSGYTEKSDAVSAAKGVKVAIVGRPNVGKSSYINFILSEDRVIVHPTAGTTRDAVDTDFNYKDRDYVLIDTAGIRHNTKLNEAADFYGSVRSKEAIRRSDVAIAIIDGCDGLREDDARILEFIIEEGKGLIIAVNKWDLVRGAGMPEYKNMLIKKMSAIRNYPVTFISCKSGRNVRSSLDLIWPIYEKAGMTIRPGMLHGILESLNSAPEIRNRRVKFIFLAQTGQRPPAFVLMTRPKDFRMMNANLKRFAENFLRMAYDFEGVPLRLAIEKPSKH